MPKLLVLFQSRSADVAQLAEAAADGAKTVRFAEVDLRCLPASDQARDVVAPDGGRAHRALEHVEDIASYDGLILVVGRDGDAGGAGDAPARALGAVRGSLANKVGAVLTPTAGPDRRAALWGALSPMADRGMILVPAPFDDTNAVPGDESARGIGKRVAEVIGWVTHARSHHHHEQHHHDHSSHHHH
jgi:hypothetical protein